jgi:hypothetical protein
MRFFLETGKEGRLNGLVTSSVGTASYYALLKERQKEG